MACGANRGNNLHLFESKDADCSRGKPNWKEVWRKTLGGEVTGIVLDGLQDRLIAGTSQGFLLCYDLDGNPVWSKLFDKGIRHLAAAGGGVLVCDNSGRIRLADPAGNMCDYSDLAAPATCVVPVRDGVYMGSENTVWRIREATPRTSS